MTDLFLEKRGVDDIELYKRVCTELVVETADRRKYGFLGIFAHRMVRSVLETDAGGEHSLLDLTYTVFIHAVVSDE